jgi:hypothetical protein
MRQRPGPAWDPCPWASHSQGPRPVLLAAPASAVPTLNPFTGPHAQGLAFTWGNGNYGKLGHKVQQDEFTPRQLEGFSKRILALPDGVVGRGGAWGLGRGGPGA